MSDVESFVRFCESEFGTAVMDREAAYVKQHASPSELVLDVGCGIGSLEERFTGYDIVGLDRSAAMVRTARDRVPTPFIRGDARRLPIATGAIDAVVSVATLEFIADADAVLSEAVRVLDPEGTFVALVLNTRSAYVQANLKRDESYFNRMVHRDTEELASKIFEYIDGAQEYFLGIEERTVVERCDPDRAAIAAIAGTPIAQSP